MKKYLVFNIEGAKHPETFTHEQAYFCCDTDNRAKQIEIKIDGEIYSLEDLCRYNNKLLIEADIYSVRFLNDGLGIARANKYYSTHESNKWNALNGMLNARLNNLGMRYLYPENEGSVIHPMIEECFERLGTLLKPGRFAKALGCTDAEAEAFSKSYNDAFKPLDTSKYEFKIVSGTDIQRYYLSDNYAQRNSSPLWSSCMNSREKSKYIKWYARNKKHVSLAVLLREGLVVARAICWNDSTMIEIGQGYRTAPEGEVIYAGKFFDRNYYYDDEALNVFRSHLDKQGAAYKLSVGAGTGDVRLPNGRVIDSSDMVIKANLSVCCGQYPYMDTLTLVSDRKMISNVEIDGKLKLAQSTSGGHSVFGEYEKVTLGCKAMYEIVRSNRVIKVLFPDGSIEFVRQDSANSIDGMSLVRASSYSNVYVIKELCKLVSANVGQYYTSNAGCADSFIQVWAYVNQLKFDKKQSKFVLDSIYCDKNEEFVSIDRVRIKADKFIKVSKSYFNNISQVVA